MCLSIGTPKIINFPFVPNGKFIFFRCPKIWANYSLIIMCSNIGTPNNHHFQFGTNGKVVVLGVPILKQFALTYSLYVCISDSFGLPKQTPLELTIAQATECMKLMSKAGIGSCAFTSVSDYLH